MKEYKFITIQQVKNELFEKKPVYRVYNKKTSEQLAIISWYKPWKKYVFSSKEQVVFDLSCLECINSFMKEI